MSVNLQKGVLGVDDPFRSAVSMSRPIGKSACILKIENHVHGNPFEFGTPSIRNYYYIRDKFMFITPMESVPYVGFQRIVDYFRENYKPKEGLTVLKLASDLDAHPDENRHPIQKLMLNFRMQVCPPQAELNVLQTS